MLVVAALFLFLSLIGWMLVVVNGFELSPNQFVVWVPVTPLGKFIKWAILKMAPMLFSVVMFFSMGILLAGMGALINIHWAFFVLPILLVLVEIVEVRRLFKTMRMVK